MTGFAWTSASPARVFGLGEETSSAKVPKSIGLPLEAGMDMGLYVMWNNHTDTNLEGVTLQLTVAYSPRNLVPRPTVVLPFKADVNIHPGAGDAFNLPPGGGSRSAVFTMPVSGRLIAVGGHLHDFGKELRLEDVKTGKVLALVRAQRAPAGEVTGVSHSYYGPSVPAQPRATFPHPFPWPASSGLSGAFPAVLVLDGEVTSNYF